MSANEGSDFATFLRMYKQWGESRNQGIPPPLNGSQHQVNQVQRPTAQRLSPSRSRPQPYRQPPPRNPVDLSTCLLQALDDVKKRQDDMYIAINTLQTMAEQINKTVDESVTTMVNTMERFEVIGRGVLEMAIQSSQPSNGASSQLQASNPPQPSQHPSQQPTFSNPQKTYQGPNATQPPAPFNASSNLTQPLFAPPAPQDSEPYDFSGGFEFLANEVS